jgi:membrane protease YdiL (CAAX protease family)
VPAFLSAIGIIVSLAAIRLRTSISRPGARRLFDIVNFEPQRIVAVAAPQARRPWGFWPSLAWLGSGAIVILVVDHLWPAWASWMNSGNDWGWRGPLHLLAWRFSQGLYNAAIVLTPLALAVHFAGWAQADYFALVRPRARDFVIGVVCAAALLLAIDATIFGLSILTSGKSPWHATGTPGLMLWSALSFAVLYAPILEELAFRGFLYRGVAQSRLGANAAMVISAFLWAVMHIYDGRGGLGLLFVFFIGLLFGWLRKRSGSTLLTILLHAEINFADALRQMLVNLGWFVSA